MSWMIGFVTVLNTLIALATLYYTVYDGFHRAHNALVLLQSTKSAKLSDEAVRELTEIAEKRIRGYINSDAKERYRSFWWAMGVCIVGAVLSGISALSEPLWGFNWFGNTAASVVALCAAIAMPFCRSYVMKFEGETKLKRRLSL